MTVKDFSKYTVDNMHKASAPNALKIATRISPGGEYDLTEFINGIVDYVNTLLSSGKIGKIKAYKVLIASDKCLEAFNAPFRYDKTMIIDNYIIDLWESLSVNK